MVQYLAAIANGLVNVAAIWLLIYTLHKNNPVFSMLTSLLYLFPSYFNLLDLGTHNQFIDEWNQSESDQQKNRAFARLILARVVLAGGAVAFSFVHSFVSGFSWTLTLALAAFIASFFPISLFYALDSYHIAKYEAQKAVAVKIIRIFATLFFIIATYLNPDSVVLPPVIYTAFLSVLGAGLLIVYFRRGVVLEVMKESVMSCKDYLRSSFRYGALTLLQVLHHSSYFSIASNLLGEDGMAPFTVATYIAVPFYLILQLVNHIKLPELSEATLTKNDGLVRSKVHAIQKLILFLGLGGLIAIPVLGLFRGYIESMLPQGVIWYAFWIYIYNFVIMLAYPVVIASQYAMRKKRIMKVFTIFWAISLPIVWLLSERYGLMGFLVSHMAFSIPYYVYLQNQLRKIESWPYYEEAREGGQVLSQASNA